MAFVVALLWVSSGFGVVLFGIAYMLYRIYVMVKLGVKGATIFGRLFAPDVAAFRTALDHSVDMGPVKSGFLGLLAFALLATLILFAVTGVRL